MTEDAAFVDELREKINSFFGSDDAYDWIVEVDGQYNMLTGSHIYHSVLDIEEVAGLRYQVLSMIPKITSRECAIALISYEVAKLVTTEKVKDAYPN